MLVLGSWAVAAPLPAARADSKPGATLRSSTSAPPRHRPFRGIISLALDATDIQHRIITARETIPVQGSGDLTLLYPEWETASHAPTVPLTSLAGFTIQVDGRRVEWRRDPFDVRAFHLPVPRGARQVTLDLQYLPDRNRLHDNMLEIPWQRALLYPAGWSASAIPVSASLRVPDGLTLVTSLDRTLSDRGQTHFATTSLDRLVDAPVFAARHVRQVELTPGDDRPIRLDLLAGDPAHLAIRDEEVTLLRELTAQTRRLFGPAPFRHYDAIVLLDDDLGAGGVEHLEESEIDLPADYFLKPAEQLNNRDLIAHELAHAWNGRFRQPADLWTETFNQPVGGSLLWVYEGQTEFWGRVLSARSGLRSRQETLDQLALDAALVANRPGRAWKSLADSTNDAVYMAGHRVAWRDWQRREDYYPEGVLLWLDVDARLRELSGGKRGLDDFALRFFRAGRTDGRVSTYSFDDVCRALDGLAHDDWPAFLRRHLDTHEQADAMAGLARAGWRLEYTPEPSETFRQSEDEEGGLDLTYSIGAIIDDEGGVKRVAWDGPAFRAGITPGMRIATVAGQPFSRNVLKLAVAKTRDEPLILESGAGPSSRRFEIDYRDGIRYPRLIRMEGRPDRLSPLLAPR